MPTFGYTMHIFSKGKLMPYKGQGRYPREIMDINTARKIACKLIPRDSETRYAVIYCDGSTSGGLIRRNGEYIYTPYYRSGPTVFSVSYIIEPTTGRVKKKMDRYVQFWRGPIL